MIHSIVEGSGTRKRGTRAGQGSGTRKRDKEAGQGQGSGTGPILLSQATFLLAHIANSGPVPLSAPRPAFRSSSRFPLLRGLDLDRVIKAVCSRYGVDRGQLAARGSRSQARAALAYLAKHHTEATRAELVPILGLSRPESVPNLSARFAALLQSESNARRDLLALERALGLSGENSKSV